MNSFFNYRISLFTLFLFLFFTPELKAQNSTLTDSIAPKQEVKLDIFQLIVLPGIEVVYERFIDDYSSWGINGFINFDFDASQAYRFENFEISPFYRFYFSKKKTPNMGFFVQPFISLTQGEYDTYSYDYIDDFYDHSYIERNFFGLAAGALIGRKWVNQKNYVFEISAGVGRLIAKEDEHNYFYDSTAYPRINFAIGKRF